MSELIIPATGTRWERKDKRRPGVVEVVSADRMTVTVRNVISGKESSLYTDNFTRRYEALIPEDATAKAA